MTKVSLFLFSILFITQISAKTECPIDDETAQGLECRGLVTVQSEAELQQYLSDYGLKIRRNRTHIRHLDIDFDYDGGSLDIATPCRVRIKDNRSFKVDGNLCINTKRFKSRENFQVEVSGDLSVYSTGDIISRKVTKFNVGGDVHLEANRSIKVSFGPNGQARNVTLLSKNQDESSRVRVIPGSNLKANSFKATAFHSVVLRRDTSFDITEDFTLQTTGNLFHTYVQKNVSIKAKKATLKSNKNITLFRNTQITADVLVIEATDTFRSNKHNQYLAENIYINATDCGNLANLNLPSEAQLFGSCTGSTPNYFPYLNASPTEGNAPLDIVFSFNEIVGDYNSLILNLGNGQTEIIGSDVDEFSYSYQQDGNFQAFITLNTPNGTVAGPPLAINVAPPLNSAPELVYTIDRTEGIVPFQLQIDASQSTDDKAIVRYSLDYAGQTVENSTGIFSIEVSTIGSNDFQLTIYDQEGLSDTAQFSVTGIKPNILPISQFTVSPVHTIAPADVNLDFSGSSDPDGTITSYQILLNGVEQTPQNEISTQLSSLDAGTYEIQLKVTDDRGDSVLSAPISLNIAANKDPIAAFSVSHYYMGIGEELTIDASTSFDDEAISAYVVDWGDSSSESFSTTTFTHTFSSEGVFRIRLTLTDRQGRSSTKSQDITVRGPNAPPIASFTVNKTRINPGQSITMDASASSDNDSSLSYEWTFNSGQTVQTRVPTLTRVFNEISDVTISLKVRDSEGELSEEFTRLISLNQSPVSNLVSNKQSGNPPLALTLDASQSSDDQNIVSYKLELPDGQVIEQSTSLFNITLEEVGTAVLKLTTLDNEGLTSQEAIQSIRVNAEPTLTPNISPAQDEVPFTLNLAGNFEDDAPGATEKWIISGLGEFAGPNHAIQVTQSGNYTIEYIVTDTDGSEVKWTGQLIATENQVPVAHIQVTKEGDIVPANVELSASGSTDDKSITSYVWEVEGQTFNSEKINHVFNQDGVNEAKLTVTDNQGLSHSTTVSFILDPNTPPVASIGTPNSELYAPSVLTFNAHASVDDEGIVEYQWSFDGMPAIVTTIPEVTQDYIGEGLKTVSLTVVDRQGLTATTEDQILLTQRPQGSDTAPPLAQYTPNALFYYDSQQTTTIQLTDDSEIDYRTLRLKLNDTEVAVTAYTIDPLLGLISFTPDATYSYNNNQYNLLTIEVTDVNGNYLVDGKRFYLQDPQILDFLGPQINYSPNGGVLENLDFDLTLSFHDISGVDFETLELKLNEITIPESAINLFPSNNQATISFNSSFPLEDGVLHIVEVSIADVLGNSKNSTIGFDTSSRYIVQETQLNDTTESIVNETNSTCVLVNNGKVKCWGDTRSDGIPNNIQYGRFDNNKIEDAPYVDIPEKVTKLVRGNGVMALTETGKVYVWGLEGKIGAFGFGNKDIIGDDETPGEYGPLPLTKQIKKISSGGFNTCAVAVDDTFTCWGRNSSGELGFPSDNIYGDTESVADLTWYSYGKPIAKLQAGSTASCLLFTDGEVRCWGSTHQGAVGFDNFKAYHSTGGMVPIDQSFPMNFDEKVIDISSHGPSSCAIFENRKAKCWGNNQSGRLGRGDSQSNVRVSSRSYMKDEPYLEIDEPIKRISTGGLHSCAITMTNKLKCWGVNNALQLGHGVIEPENDLTNIFGSNFALGDDESITTQGYVNTGETEIKAVNVERLNTCIQNGANQMKCWSWNQLGILGQNTFSNDLFNTPIADLPYAQLGETLDEPLTESVLADGDKGLAFFQASSYSALPNEVITFTATSDDPTINSYEWNFGDTQSQTTSLKTITHNYSDLGTYYVTLKAFNSQQELLEEFQSVINITEQNIPPVASLEASHTELSIPETVIFDASNSFDANGVITNYLFDFGDGQSLSSTTPVVTHQYSKVGVFLVTLKTMDDSGNISQEASLAVTALGLNQRPIADFTCIESHYSIDCDASGSFDFDGSVVAYQWNWDDGTTTAGVTATKTYTTPGKGAYLVTLKVIDNDGEFQLHSKQIVVDRVAPQISTEIASNTFVNSTNLSIPVTITDDSQVVSTVSVNGIIVENYDTHQFVINASLIQGDNTIDINTIDGAGNAASHTLTQINLDTQGPVLSTITPSDDSRVPTIIFDITGISNEQLKEVHVNDIPMSLAQDALSFSGPYNGQSQGTKELHIVATDLHGNTTEQTIQTEVFIPLFNPNLITIFEPTIENPNLRIAGAAAAFRLPDLEIEADGGFFNSKTIQSNSDGSFLVELDSFSEATLTALNPATSTPEEITLTRVANTSVAGQVLTLNDIPIPNVKVILSSTGQSVYTDNAGNFELQDIPSGDQVLRFDGAEVNPTLFPDQEFKETKYNTTLALNRKTIIPAPVYISSLLLDGTETEVQDGASAIVTSVHAPGVEVDIPADMAVFPDGTNTGKINIQMVSANKVSVPLPNGIEAGEVITLEPSGLTFKEPVPVKLPNSGNYPPGMQVVIMSKNSNLGLWEIDGVAVVEEDGSAIKTKDGMGISHFSDVFALPIAPKVSAVTRQDVPGADLFNGTNSAQISLPTYKSLGNDVGVSLAYNSAWAHPTALVKNIIDIPRGYVHVYNNQEVDLDLDDLTDKPILKAALKYVDYSTRLSFMPSVVTGIFDADVEASTDIESWVEPDYIEAQFQTSNIKTENYRFTGIPNNSLISFGVDLSTLQTGVYPYNTKYVTKVDNKTISTFKGSTSVSIFGLGQSTSYNTVIREQFSKVFDSSVGGSLFVKNQKQGAYGSGWDVLGNSRIYNPTHNRLMVKTEDGNYLSYTLDTAIDTVFYNEEGIDSVSFDGDNQISFLQGDHLKTADINIDNSNDISSFSSYSGSYAESLREGREVCRFDAGICVSKTTKYWCVNYNSNYHVSRRNRGLLNLGENGIFSVDANGIIHKTLEGSTSRLIGSIGNPGRRNKSSFCSKDGVSCGSSQRVGEYPAPHCNDTHHSTGSAPHSGNTLGALNSSSLNEPFAIIKGLRPNTLIVADSGNHAVKEIDLTTNSISIIAGNQDVSDYGNGVAATEAGIRHPRGLVYDKLGNLYISSEQGYIRKVDANGVITTFAGLPVEKGGLFEDTLASKRAFVGPTYMAIDDENRFLYVSDTADHRVIAINLVTGYAETIAGNGSCGAQSGDTSSALDASLCSPEALALDNEGNLLIHDKGHKSIRRVSVNRSSLGALAFLPSDHDNSKLIKFEDGHFERSLRNGTVYTYDDSGTHLETTHRNGLTITYDYNSEGKLTSIEDSVGSQTLFNYSGGKLTSVVDPTGRNTQFTYNGEVLDQVSFPDGTVRNFEYDTDGLLTKETNQRGFETTFEYNAHKRLSVIHRPQDNDIQLIDSASNAALNEGTSNQLNPDLYDGIVDARGIETKFITGTDGFVAEITDGDGRVTKIERNAYGDPTLITKPDNSTVEFTYDEITRDLLKKVDSNTAIEITYSYNEFGQLLTQTDPRGFTIENIYNENGYLIESKDQANQSTFFEYNDLGLVTKTTDQNGNSLSRIYDNFGNLIKTVDSLNIETQLVRDAAGNVTKAIDSNNNITLNSYDEFNRLLSVTSAKSEVTTYEYLGTGQLAKIVDPRSQVTIFDYDSLGRMIKKTDPSNRVVELAYDENGNVTTEIDYAGNTKTFEYDALNRLVKKLLPDNTYSMIYDVRNNLTQVKNLHSQIDYTYIANEAGYLIESETVKGIGPRSDLPTHTLNYQYDNIGNRVGMDTSVGHFSYQYDGRNRLTALTNHKSESFTFTYDNAGRMTDIARPGSHTKYDFDATNFITKISHSKTSDLTDINFFEFSRDALGNRTQIRTKRSVANYSYDQNNQLTSANDTEGVSESFTYDSLGNRLTDSSGNYIYDDKFQRIKEDFRYIYAFDDNGNLSTKIEKSNQLNFTNYLHDSENRLIGIDTFENNILQKQVTYTYDPVGRRIEKHIDHLVDNTQDFTRRFVYDGNEAFLELDETNSILATYTHSTLRTDDTLAMDVTNAGQTKGRALEARSYFYLKDALGSVKELVNNEGVLVQSYVYSSFGSLQRIQDANGLDITATPIVSPHFTYTNREYDLESGLYYYRARYYEPKVGKFIQEDPHSGYKSNPLTSTNRYNYVLNSPQNYLDPHGKEVFTFLAYAALTALADTAVSYIANKRSGTGYNFLEGFGKRFGANILFGWIFPKSLGTNAQSVLSKKFFADIGKSAGVSIASAFFKHKEVPGELKALVFLGAMVFSGTDNEDNLGISKFLDNFVEDVVDRYRDSKYVVKRYIIN